MDILLISVGYSIVQVCCCSILAYLLVAPVESAADSCKVSAQRPSKPYTSICSPLMALPAAWSDHTAVVEFLLEKGAAVASAEVRPRCILQLRSSLAHSTLPFHTAVPRCRSMLQNAEAAKASVSTCAVDGYGH